MLKNNIILLMGIAGSGKKTIGEAITQRDHSIKLAHHHAWIDPILKLLGEDEQVWWTLDDKGWAVINQAHDVILNTIADVCPRDGNIVITNEMLASNPYHQDYFDKVQRAALRRNATLTPVRLICECDELLNRVQSDDRKAYFKTRDVDLIRRRFAEEQVFFSRMPNEFTLNVTDLTPNESAEKILDWVISRQ